MDLSDQYPPSRHNCSTQQGVKAVPDTADAELPCLLMMTVHHLPTLLPHLPPFFATRFINRDCALAAQISSAVPTAAPIDHPTFRRILNLSNV